MMNNVKRTLPVDERYFYTVTSACERRSIRRERDHITFLFIRGRSKCLTQVCSRTSRWQ